MSRYFSEDSSRRSEHRSGHGPEHRPEHLCVTRVADFEPAPVLASLVPAACRVPRPAGLHQPSRARPAHVAHAAHHHDRVPPQLAAFADAAMRRVLEVLDRRRTVAQLRPLLADAPLSAVTMLSSLPPAANPARLCKVRVRPCGPATAELFGTYQRGDRVGALAGRLECARERWLVVALQIG